MGLKTIVLVTTGQPSVNPRIVKEADALQEAGFKVIVLYSFWIEWAMSADVLLLKKVKWNYYLIGGSPFKNKWRYSYTKARLKASRFLNKKLGNKFLLAERSQARCYDELLKAAKSIKADWYIGHNLGALAVAVRAAKINHGKCGFDFEDYHREESENAPLFDQRRILYLEEKYCEQLDYISTSSPLITNKIKSDFPSYTKPVINLLNAFPLLQQPAFRQASQDGNQLQLFWFSQTIGYGRGLEILMQALKKINDTTIHLTLAGNCTDQFKIYLKNEAGNFKDNLQFAGIISPEKLPSFAASFDVGLAIEQMTPNNRNICLTNKVFTYLMAGNAIILSNTAMQKEFNEAFKIGAEFSIDNPDELVNKIKLYRDKDLLTQQRLYNYKLATDTLNWENEAKKLLAIVN